MGGCKGCDLAPRANLRRMGVHTAESDFVVALAGNPNTGKSTVFNALTGLRQHTGNWPGKTVSRAEGGFAYGEHAFRLIDLPGTYSLLATSTDEEVARDFLLFGQPDVTVAVVDATRLERNLNLVLQVLEITPRVVVCVNLLDEARRHHITVDLRALSRELGVPVVGTAARQREGIDRLVGSIAEVATGGYRCRPRRIELQNSALTSALAELEPRIRALYPELPNVRWVAARLIEGDDSVTRALQDGTLGGTNGEIYVQRGVSDE